uniref:Uncharacterized protein n=1 Tax=Oryza rufipogon TaxID=4529 RepID=A0A0E0NDY8_ORYRU
MGAQPWWRFLALLLPLLVAVSFLMSFNFAYSEGGQISEHVAQERWQQQLELCDGEQGRRPASDEGNSALLSIFT